MSEYDLVIRGGRVVDGTGAPERTADIAVKDGVIAEVGQVSGAGAQEVEADGALVTPGWVDIHTHYDGQATWDSQLAPSSWHGATTVVFGNCGVGFAPVRPADHQRLIELMEGVEDIPGSALNEGLPWTWQTFGEYLDALEGVQRDIDCAAQVPHGALRLHVMGERGAQREMATPDDIDKMGAIARAGIEAGALGFTTSRTMNHRTSRGEPTPTLTASADELIGIAAEIGKANTGVLQVVSDYVNTDAEFDMLREMVRQSGRPLSLSLAASPIASDNHMRILDRIEQANAEGLDIKAQVAARAVGLIFGLECSINPFMMNPVYKEIAALPAAEQAKIMREPGFRDRLFAAASDEKVRKLGGGLATFFDRMFVLEDPPNYEPDPSMAVGSAERAYDLLSEGDGSTLFYVPFLNYIDGGLDEVGKMLAHPFTIPGLSDGGAHVGTICDGSFPTTLLTMWARDRERGRLEVPFLVQRQCRDTARQVGLLDRGVLAPGYKADVNVIDFDNLQSRRPEIRFDLPAGGKRLLQRAEGYKHTFINGVEIYRDGEHTGALPGRLVRGAQPAPVA